MKYEAYLDKLRERFEKHFCIETDMKILGERIDMYARFTNISGRTFITKHDVIDRYENHEFCYIKRYGNVSGKELLQFMQFLKKTVDEYVNPGADHMSTYVTGVMVVDGISDELRKTVEKFSHSKAYMFYLRGWCDVRLVCVDLADENIITNRAGRKVKKVYQITSQV